MENLTSIIPLQQSKKSNARTHDLTHNPCGLHALKIGQIEVTSLEHVDFLFYFSENEIF